MKFTISQIHDEETFSKILKKAFMEDCEYHSDEYVSPDAEEADVSRRTAEAMDRIKAGDFVKVGFNVYGKANRGNSNPIEVEPNF
ncbi:hypothetical protein SDC9_57787 [bioreactor metagenome]|uniref:Uncharacterized protein n=1 Tax=bioreactor metagenome TaxID=1076179 RepID=A0A644XB88_9ZZZZ